MSGKLYEGAGGRSFFFEEIAIVDKTSCGEQIVCDAAGNVVFNTMIEEDGVEKEAIMLYGVNGEFTILLAEGDMFDVDAGVGEDLREIAENSSPYLSFIGDFALNDLGELAVGLNFTDGSHGVFTMMIPEPSCLMMLGLGGLALLRRRAA